MNAGDGLELEVDVLISTGSPRGAGAVGLAVLLLSFGCGAEAPTVTPDAGFVEIDAGVFEAPDAGEREDLGAILTDAGLDSPDVVVDAGPVGPTLTATISPSHGTPRTSFVVTVGVEGFTLEAPSDPPREGAGHYHYYLDGRTFRYNAGWSGQETVSSTVRGEHTLTVYLVDGIHGTIRPPVAHTITFWVD